MIDKYSKKVQRLGEKIPVHYVRFEDVRMKPSEVLTDLFKFLFEVDSIDGTVLEKRIIDKCGVPPQSVYKLKSNSTSLSRNVGMYTDA